jgi:hypothetical protein
MGVGKQTKGGREQRIPGKTDYSTKDEVPLWTENERSVAQTVFASTTATVLRWRRSVKSEVPEMTCRRQTNSPGLGGMGLPDVSASPTATLRVVRTSMQCSVR